MLREFDPDTASPPQPSLAKSGDTSVDSSQAQPTPVNPPETSKSEQSESPQQPEQSASTLPTRGFWPVLKNRNFLILWLGQVFSQLADKVYLVLMIAIIASQFEVPGQTISGWVSAIMIAFTIPAVLFGSLAGVYVDRWAKKPVLVLTNLLRGGFVLALPLVLWGLQGWGSFKGIPLSFCALLIVTFGVSTLTQFFAPAEQAAIPLIVDKPNLLSANSLYTTTMMASVIIGFAVGEPLLAAADGLFAPLDQGTGIGKELLVGAAYGLAGLILLLMHTRENRQPEEKNQSHPWQDIQDGLRYIKNQPQVRTALIQLVLLFCVFAALAVLAVRLAEIIPNLRPSQFGLLLASGGVGMAVGAGIVGQFGHQFRRLRLSMVGSFGMTATLVGLAFTTDRLWLCLGLIGLLGVFAAIVGIPMQTTIQEKTPEEMRGKVFGLQNNLVNIALSLPLALAGLAEAALGLSPVFLGLAAFVAGGGLLTWYVSHTGNSNPAPFN